MVPETSSPAESIGALTPGTIIAERYRIESLLGEGGMGAVYLAEHVHLRKRVALKVLLPEWSRTPAVLARFEREAIAGGSIAHPNVASTTDFGRLPEGSFFLVLEYVAGRTLRDVLAEGALPPARALKIVRGMASAIAAAHAQGVVHRDLKPENVMLVTRDDDPDFVKVLDFGIARIDSDDIGTARGLTTAGMIIGTPDYMAPEQALGGTIDARTDLYSVGVILFELLTGACPFRGGAATVIRQHVIGDAPQLPSDVGFDPRIAALLDRLLQKSPDARPSSANELIAAIDECGRETANAPESRVLVRAAGTSGAASTNANASANATGDATINQRRARLVVVACAALTVVLTMIGFAVMHDSAKSDDALLAPPVMAPPTRDSQRAAASTAPETPAPNAPSSARPATSMPAPSSSKDPPKGGGKRKTGPGGIYVPPPSQWFR